MNTAKEHAFAVWRTPSPSIDAMEGALLAYAAEVTEQLRADLETARRERDEFGQKIDATANMVANIQDTLRVRGFVMGGLEKRVIHMAQALDGATDKLATVEAHNERLRGALEEQDRYIINNRRGGDWACKECHPADDGVKAGFQCAYHRAMSRRDEALSPTEGKLNIGAEEPNWAFCCNTSRVESCDCVNPDHGKVTLNGDKA